MIKTSPMINNACCYSLNDRICVTEKAKYPIIAYATCSVFSIVPWNDNDPF